MKRLTPGSAATADQLRAARGVLGRALGFAMVVLVVALAAGARGWLLVGVAGAVVSLILQVLVLSVLIRRNRAGAVEDEARA